METHLTREFLEAILIMDGRKKSVFRIEEMNVKPAVEEGISFLGFVSKVELKLVQGDGTQCDYSIMIKTMPQSMQMKIFLTEKGAFTREIKMLTEVLPHMTAILKRSKEYIEPLWPECISVHNYNTILMHDLGMLGYKMMDRIDFLDLDTSIFVIQSLARFHAVSVVAKDHFLIDPNDFKRYWFGDRNKFMEELHKNHLMITANLIKNEWEKEWSRIGDEIEYLADTVTQRIEKLTSETDSNFEVLNHVDPKTPNMLFKFCTITDKLVGVRFLDYQCTYYGSFAVDLQFFLYNAVDPEVREEHYERLITSYHESLLKTFQLLNHEPLKLPSLDDIKVEMKKFEFVGIVTALIMLPLIFIDKDHILKLEEIKSGETDINKSFTSEKFKQAVRQLLTPYFSTGLSKIYPTMM